MHTNLKLLSTYIVHLFNDVKSEETNSKNSYEIC